MRSEREHVTLYIRNRRDAFRIGQIRRTPDLSHLRWTVDELADLEFMRRIFARLDGKRAGMNEVLTLLQSEPGLQRMNQGIGRDEGLARSLREDACVR
jgi:spore coat polysaccharide biosynthesis protein SpsF (cytidylyltransferase family)